MKTTYWGMLALGPAFGVLAVSACASEGGVAAGSTTYDGAAGALDRDDAAEIPCAPRQVLIDVCQKCHARPASNGAPFPLERRSDVFVVYGGVTVRDLMIEQLDARRMPLVPVTIDDGQRDVLLEWLRAGAPATVPQTCSDAGAIDAEAGTDANDAETDTRASDAVVGSDAADEGGDANGE